ncbi:treacle protein isoform X2 [Sorex araneus]|uniref:treacle protein isoform X2 n=1 Tax=Sorex araneus TaxID=42254 RepID=UPI002433C46F|nr:treacle protein isoform X2 [Sorex araneus]
MAEARKRRELLPLIYQHLLQAGYVRAAREVKEQSGQKNLLAQPVTLLDIYTHWQQTSEVGQKRKAEDDAALQAKKKRVSDPVSSSESSEEEEEEAEAPRTAPRVSLTNSSAVRTVLPTDLKEKTPAKPKASKMGNSTALPTPGKMVAQLLSGKSPRKSSGPSADAVLVSETEEEGSVRAAGTPGPPGVTSVGQASSSSDDTSSSSDETDVEVKPSVKAAQVRACPAPAKESPGKKAAPAPGKTAVTPPAQLTMVNRAVKQEVDSESTEGSESEEEGALVAAPSQGKGRQPSEKPGQARGAPGATPAKGTPGKGVVSAAPGKAASATPRAQPGRPQEDSETSSSEESDSEEEAPATTTPAQAKPSGKPTQVRAASALTTPSPRKGAPPVPTSRAGPAASQSREEEEEEEDSSGEEPPHRPASARAAPAQAKSLGKSPQSKAAPARGPSMGPPGKGAAPSTSAAPAGTRQDVSESSSSSSSSDESDSDEEAPPSGPPAQVKAALKTPLTQVSPRKGTPVPPVPAKATTARAGTLASPALARVPQKPEDSSSSEESESEEEMAAAVGQPQALRKSLPVRAALTPTKAPSGQGTTSTLPQKAGPVAAPTRVEVPEDSTSSEDSDSDEAVRTPAQVPAKTLQTKPTPTPASPRAALPKGAAASGKVAPAAAAAKQGSPAKAKLPARSPAVGKGAAGAAQARSAPTGAEEDSDSSEEDSDSSEGAPPAQAKAPGLNSQVRAAPSPAKGSPRKGARPAPPGTPGPTAPSAGRRQDAECSSSSSSSTESDSEEDAPAPGSTTRKESNSKASGRKAPAATPQKKPEGSLESSEVIKLPLIFVDPNRSPAGPAAAPARAQAAGGPRKARASESTAGSSSSESEDEDVIPATQCSTPAISLSAVSGPMAFPRGSPKAAPAGTSSSKTSSQGTDGKKQQATGTQVTKKKPGGLPLTQATLRVLAQTASEAQAPAARTPPAAGVGPAPKTHAAATAHGTPTHARAAAPSAHTKADDSGTSGDSEDSSPESEENPPPRLDAASSKETVVEETSAESSEDEEPEPSQSLLSGCVAAGPAPAAPQPAKTLPGPHPSASGASAPAAKDAPRGKQGGGLPHAAGVTPPAAGVSGRSKAGTSPQTPQKEALSPQAYVLALQSDIAQRLLSEPRTQSKAQAQASVVKVLAELLEQERRKALEATKDSGGKGRSGHKRKLQGDQVTAKAPEKRKKQLATQEGGEGTASPEKAPGTSRGKPKKDRPSGDSKKKKKKKADPNCCVATGKPEGTQGQGDIKGGSLKNKKDKSKKKDKEKKEKKKKAKKASTKDSDAILQKKKKKKKKKAEAPV